MYNGTSANTAYLVRPSGSPKFSPSAKASDMPKPLGAISGNMKKQGDVK